MLRDKIRMLMKYRNETQRNFFDIFGVSSDSAMTNKLTLNRVTTQQLIKLCEKLDCEVVVRDKNNGNEVLKFDITDTE